MTEADDRSGTTAGSATEPVPASFYALRCGMTDRDDILFDLCMALRKVPHSILRDLGKRRLPINGMAEKIVAEAILDHLELCGWRLEHRPKPTVTPAR